MKKTPAWQGKSLRRALGVLLLSASGFLTVISTETPLQAFQESASGDIAFNVKRPRAIDNEALDILDAGLVEKLEVELTTLFESSKTISERRNAANALQAQTQLIPENPAAVEELKRRLERTAALMDAALAALEVSTTDTAKSNSSSLMTAVAAADAFLGQITNGHLWNDYLHLTELRSGNPSPETMAQVFQNLTVLDSLSLEQRNFIRRPAIQELKAAVESASASASFPSDEAGARADLVTKITQLVDALFAYDKEPLETEAEKARSAWRTVRSRYPTAASALRHTVNTRFFNHNVHITISETLLSRLISNYRTESGCIADCILGAWVTGSQTTNVDVNVDVLPSTTTANFQLKVSGNTQSSTKAVKSPATVWTSGNHYFWMNRSVSFDGNWISASPVSFSADANSQTVGLATKYDKIPIVRRIVRNIATQKIAESKPQSEALTVSRMREKAVPEFQRETDQQFADGNSTFSKTMASLDRRGVKPDSISARSSNTHVAFSSRTIGIGRLGGSLQPPSALMATGLSAQLHQSALNNAIDALGFQGKVVPEKELVSEIEKALGELFQREVKLTNGQPSASPPASSDEEADAESSFVFSETDPIRVEFKSGQVVVILRTGIRQEGREEIPQQTITIPIALSLKNGKVLLEPDNFAIAGPGNSRKPQIKRILDRRIATRELSPTVDLQAAGDKTLPLTISYIELTDGWLTIEAQ